MSLVDTARNIGSSVANNAINSVKSKISDLTMTLRNQVTGDSLVHNIPTILLGGKPITLSNIKSGFMDKDYLSMDNLGQFSRIQYTIKGGIYWNNTGNRMEITLQDNSGTIEEHILNNTNTRNFDIILPFSVGNETVLKMMIDQMETNYGITNELNISCITLGADGRNSVGQKNSATYREMSISDIVKFIVNRNPNWELGEVEDTKPVQGKNGEEHMEFVQNNVSDYEFINSVLKQAAQSLSTGAADYVFYVDETKYPSKVYFTPRKNKEESAIFEFSIGDVQNAKDGTVISFKPAIQNLSSMIVVSEGEESKPVVIPDKSEYLESFNTKPDERVGYESLTVDIDTKYNQQRTISLLQRTLTCTMSAGLEIYGIDPNLKINDVIAIYAYRNNGSLHYSSGKYFITQIVWNIENGKCTTELDLRRDSSIVPIQIGQQNDGSDKDKGDKAGKVKEG